MKHLLIIFALATIGLSGNLIAQEQAVESSTSVSEATKTDTENGVKMDLNFGDDEKIDKFVDGVGKINNELAEELKVEIDGLSEEEKAELVSKFEDGFDVGDIPMEAIAIPIVAIISVFGLPLFIVIVLVMSSHRKRKQKMELVNLYMANNKDLPEHVITAFDSGGAANSLRSGLTLTAVGIALVAAFGGEGAGNFGLIPLFLGIARLIYWYLEERTPKSNPEQDDPKQQ